MSLIGELIVRIGADISDVASELSKAEGKFSAFGGRMQSIGGGMTAGLTLPLVAGFGLAVKAAGEAEDGLAKLDAVLTATGGVAGVTAGHVGKLADHFHRTTVFGDDAAVSAATLLLTFKGIRNEVGAGNDVFDRTLKVAGDMATVLGTDLNGAAMQVAKAIENPIRGMTALTRSGVSFTEAEREVIKQLQEAGDLMGAQKIVLQALEGQFTGSAAAMAKTANGQMAMAFNELGEIAEVVGGILLPIVTKASGLVTRLAGNFQGLSPRVQETIVVVAGVVAGVGPLLLTLGTLIKLLPLVKIGFVALTGPIGLTIAAVTSAIAIWAIFGDDITRIATAVYTAVQTYIGNRVTGVLNLVKVPVDAVVGFFAGMRSAVEGTVSALVTGIQTHLVGRFTAIVDAVRAKVAAVTGVFHDMYMKIVGGSIVPDLLNGIAAEFGRLPSVMVAPAMTTTTQVGSLFETMASRNIAAMQAQSAKVETMRQQFVALGGSLDQVAVSSASMANGFSGSLGIVGKAISAITGGKSTSIGDALSGLLGGGGGSGGIGGILGGIAKGVGGNLLGGLGLSLAGGPVGIAAALGTKLLTPVVGNVVGKVGGFIGGLFGKKKKAEPAAPTYTTPTYAPPSYSGGYADDYGASDTSTIEQLLREVRDELRATTKVQQAGFRETVDLLDRNVVGLDSVRAQIRRNVEIAVEI